MGEEREWAWGRESVEDAACPPGVVMNVPDARDHGQDQRQLTRPLPPLLNLLPLVLSGLTGNILEPEVNNCLTLLWAPPPFSKNDQDGRIKAEKFYKPWKESKKSAIQNRCPIISQPVCQSAFTQLSIFTVWGADGSQQLAVGTENKTRVMGPVFNSS